MINKMFYSTVIMCLLHISPVFTQTLVKRTGVVKYISKQTYYINLGTSQGLKVGDRVLVVRNRRIIGELVVEHVARLSAACRLKLQKAAIQSGDRVEINVRVENKIPVSENAEIQKNRKSTSSITPKPSRRALPKRKQNSSNRIKGRMAVQSLWFDDLSLSGLDYNQLALRMNLKVEKVLALPFEFRIRWRSRAHHRERSLSSEIPDNEWTHNVYELGLVYENKNSLFEFGFGRVLSSRIRGIGYIDGGLFSFKTGETLRIGLAGGTQPTLVNSSFQTREKKFGFFVNYEQGDFQTQKISSTVAFSGRYHDGEASREFFYMQNNFWRGSLFSIYQTVEVDINRGWKSETGKISLQLSNVFVSTRYTPAKVLSLNASYDARRNIRVFETRSIPDSLFDENTRQGLHSGFVLRLTNRIRLSGNFGVRFRQGEAKNTLSASGGLSVRNLFNTWTTFNARISYFSTMFTKGYRPSVSLRIPVLRDLSFNFSGGSYTYQTRGITTSSYWMEADGYYRINQWLFTNFGYRMYFDERLKSNRLFIETGVVF